MNIPVKVATELGVDIYCDTEGNFTSRVNEEYVRFKNIKKVKEAIQRAAPTVELTDLADKGRGYYHNTLSIQRVQIASVDEHYGRIIGRPSTSPSRYSGTQYAELHVPDDAVEEELKAINLDYVGKVKALDEAYNASIFAAKAKMTRVTPELFATMLAEAKK